MFTRQPLFVIATLIIMSGGSCAWANLPSQASLNQYKLLWENSALTREPKKAAAGTASQLQEWLLGGVLDLGGDYMVTLKHKTKPESQRFNLNELKKNAATGFELAEVQMDSKNWKETKVAFKDNKGKINWISFDLNRQKTKKSANLNIVPRTSTTAATPTSLPTTTVNQAQAEQQKQQQTVTKKKIFYNKSSSQPKTTQSSP